MLFRSNGAWRWSKEHIRNGSNSEPLSWTHDVLPWVEYIDPVETNVSLIAIADDAKKYPPGVYTHLEIHCSTIFGAIGNSVIFPEHNQLPVRDLYACGQMKQAISTYHTNHTHRFDKMVGYLNYGQSPIVQSKYDRLIHDSAISFGVNAVVAVMSYDGYNVEDAVLINQGSILRGMF